MNSLEIKPSEPGWGFGSWVVDWAFLHGFLTAFPLAFRGTVRESSLASKNGGSG